jgi:hypothetical protein
VEAWQNKLCKLASSAEQAAQAAQASKMEISKLLASYEFPKNSYIW